MQNATLAQLKNSKPRFAVAWKKTSLTSILLKLEHLSENKIKIPKATRNMAHATTSDIKGSIYSGGCSSQNYIEK